jgi:hypothetical protein
MTKSRSSAELIVGFLKQVEAGVAVEELRRAHVHAR